MRPLIGISLGLDDRGRWNPEREYLYVDTAYARAVDAAGGTPVHLPIQEDGSALVDRLDGLLIPGGDDFEPPTPYPDRVRFDPAPKRQVDFDRRLLARALERGIPFLGICYGMQLLVLALGGALHYDLATDRPESADHKLPERDGRHRLRIEAGSRLAALLGAAEVEVNSLHHQAVAEPGARLRVCARAEDGVIEAVESPGAAFRLGVQWHPEKLEAPHRDAVFRGFIAACGGRGRRP